MNPFDGTSAIALTRHGEVEYQLEGESGPLLIGLHGSPGSCFQMSAFMNRLQLDSKRCRRLNYCRPGYRGTPLAGGPTIAGQSDLLAALLDALKLTDPAILVGFSGGGISALDFAARYPERVAKLLLLSPVTGKYPMFGQNFFERIADRIIYSYPIIALAQLLMNRWPRLVLWGILANMNKIHGAELKAEVKRIAANPTDTKFLLNMVRRCHPFTTLSKGIWNDNRNVTSVDDSAFKNIKHPILLVHGEHDADVSIKQSEQLHELLPADSQLLRVPNGGHLLLVDPHLNSLRRRIKQFCEVR